MSVRRDRFVLAGMTFGVLLAQVLLYPGIDTLVTALGATTPLDASMWFLAAEFAAFVVFAGVWGAVSDWSGRRRRFITLSTIAGAAGYALLAVLPQVVELTFRTVVGLRVLQGAATIGSLSLVMTMLMDLPGGHGKNMGAAGIAIGSGMTIGSPLGGQLYEIGPFVPLYTASVVLAILGVLSLAVTDRAPSSERSNLRGVLTSLQSQPALGVPYVFGFVDRLTAGFFALVGTLYFRTAFVASPGTTGILLALFFAPFALFQYPFGILSDSIGRTVPVVVGSSAYGLGIIGVGLAPSIQSVGAMMALVGVLGALMAPATMALVTDIASDTRRGVAMAGFNVFGSLGFLAGIVVGGTTASEFGYLTAFVTVGGFEVVLALIAVPMFLRWRRTGAMKPETRW